MADSKLTIHINAKDNATGVLSKIKGMFGGIASVASGMLAAGAIQAVGGQLVSFAKDAVSGASDMNEIWNKVGVTFGGATDQIKKEVAGIGTSLGQTQLQMLDAASTFGVFGKSAGLTGSDLGDFSMDLVGLSSDLASFHNADPQEVIQALGGALRGEAEPMRRFGVLLDDATLRQKALEMGLVKTTKEALTPQQKVLAAYNVIMAQTVDAQGDFLRTSDGFANQQRILSAQWSEMKTQIGQAILPLLTSLASVVSEKLLPAMSAFVTNVVTPMIPKIQALSEILGNFLGKLFEGDFQGAFQVLADGLTAAFGEETSAKVMEFAKIVQDVFSWVRENVFPILKTLWSWLQEAVPAAIKAVSGAFTTLLLPALKEHFAYLQANILPIIQELFKWLAENLPTAIEALSKFWTDVLQPALEVIWEFLINNVLPVYRDVYTWMLKNLVDAIKVLAGFFLNTLLPALGNIWAYFNANIMPILKQVFEWLKIHVPEAIQVVTSAWNTKLLPAIMAIWEFFDGSLLPIVREIVEFFSLVFGKAIEALSIIWKDNLLPALKDIWSWLSEKLQPVFEVVADFLNKTLGPAFQWISDNPLKAAKNAINDLLGPIQSVTQFLSDLNKSISNFDVSKLLQAAGLKVPSAPGSSTSKPGKPAPKTTNPYEIYFGKALGGAVMSGLSYLVGEQGPELFVPRQSGMIIPNNKLSMVPTIKNYILHNENAYQEPTSVLADFRLLEMLYS